ncbi:MAG: hypothetical protein IJV01_00715 [Bacteroidales bacterium]|nr:hypothetical protein [Bacteroidales bacterium]
MKTLTLLFSLLLALAYEPAGAQTPKSEVSLTSLLKEIGDVDELARFKDYEFLQSSSYARTSYWYILPEK